MAGQHPVAHTPTVPQRQKPYLYSSLSLSDVKTKTFTNIAIHRSKALLQVIKAWNKAGCGPSWCSFSKGVDIYFLMCKTG